ncbi:hypothetical protein PPACK8108_LOCUS19680 [Phakopsora pachyrhizi]|uniref:Uncharacterized protein n=1 Tax=Phakopsora pachyrhizi TaxID=170000 RepID=A0AAV0BCZ3_PHAPC|nr:hypothetical protein PPACK8108_LOCUS19680 [Phakopsora pachyrhizi]
MDIPYNIVNQYSRQCCLWTNAYSHFDQGPNGPSLSGLMTNPQRVIVKAVDPQGLQSPTSHAKPKSRLNRYIADCISGKTLMPLATLTLEVAILAVYNAKEQKVTKDAAEFDLPLLSKEPPESKFDFTPILAALEDSEMHDGTVELGNRQPKQPRQQETSNDFVISEAAMRNPVTESIQLRCQHNPQFVSDVNALIAAPISNARPWPRTLLAILLLQKPQAKGSCFFGAGKGPYLNISSESFGLIIYPLRDNKTVEPLVEGGIFKGLPALFLNSADPLNDFNMNFTSFKYSSNIKSVFKEVESIKPAEKNQIYSFTFVQICYAVHNVVVQELVYKKGNCAFHHVPQPASPSFFRHIAPMAQKDLNTQWNAHTFGSCKLIANFGTGGSRIISLAEETNQRNSGSLGNKLSGPNIASHVTASKTQLWKHAVPHVLLKAGNNFTWTHGRLGLERRLSPKTSLGFHLCSIRPRIPAIVEAQYSDSNILLPSYTPTSAVVLAAPPIKASKTDKGNKQQFTVLLYACFDMSWMSESLDFYNKCKMSFMILHHRKGKSPIKSSFSSQLSSEAIWKHKILNFIFCDLIPTEPNKQPNTALWSQMKSAISRARTIQDATEEPVNTHYRRLNALLDLTFHLLTAAPIAKSLSANPSDAAIQISKSAVMLSNALGNVDLNYPSIQEILSSVPLPLEQLVKVGKKTAIQFREFSLG